MPEGAREASGAHSGRLGIDYDCSSARRRSSSASRNFRSSSSPVGSIEPGSLFDGAQPVARDAVSRTYMQHLVYFWGAKLEKGEEPYEKSHTTVGIARHRCWSVLAFSTFRRPALVWWNLGRVFFHANAAWVSDRLFYSIAGRNRKLGYYRSYRRPGCGKTASVPRYLTNLVLRLLVEGTLPLPEGPAGRTTRSASCLSTRPAQLTYLFPGQGQVFRLRSHPLADGTCPACGVRPP